MCFSFLKIVSLPLHINFEISLSVSTQNKTACWNFEWDYIDSIDPFVEHSHLKKLSFPIYELGIAFHLVVSALISLQKKVIF